MKKALSSLFIAEGIARALSFLIIIYAARSLGASELGYWSYALALNAFLIIATNLGLDVYAMVEATKDLARRAKLYSNTLAIKSILLLIALGILWSMRSFFGEKLFLLILLLLCADFLSSLTPVWYYQVAEEFRSISVVKLTQSISYAAFAFTLLWWHKSITMLAFAYLGAYLLSAVIFARDIFKELSLAHLQPRTWHRILKVSIYLGGALFLNQIYTNTDKIMIANMLGTTYNGYYEAGYKLYALVPVLFSIVWTVYAPKVAKDKSYFKRFSFVILSLALVSAAIFFLFKDLIILTLYGASFAETTKLMDLFALSVVALGLSYTATSPLALFEKSREWFWIAFFSFLLNITLNFLLIPTLQLRGALIATIAAECATAIFGFYVLQRVYSEKL